MSDAILWYNTNSEGVSRCFEPAAAEAVYGWLVKLNMPTADSSELRNVRTPSVD